MKKIIMGVVFLLTINIFSQENIEEPIDYKEQVNNVFSIVQKMPKKATLRLKQLCEMMDKDKTVEKEVHAEGYYFLAVAFALNNFPKYYFENIAKALEIYPDYIEALNHRGQIYFKMEEYEKAKIDLEKVLVLDKDYKEANETLKLIMKN